MAASGVAVAVAGLTVPSPPAGCVMVHIPVVAPPLILDPASVYVPKSEHKAASGPASTSGFSLIVKAIVSVTEVVEQLPVPVTVLVKVTDPAVMSRGLGVYTGSSAEASS